MTLALLAVVILTGGYIVGYNVGHQAGYYDYSPKVQKAKQLIDGMQK